MKQKKGREVSNKIKENSLLYFFGRPLRLFRLLPPDWLLSGVDFDADASVAGVETAALLGAEATGFTAGAALVDGSAAEARAAAGAGAGDLVATATSVRAEGAAGLAGDEE
jgi:hypothetical protein